MGQCLVAAIMVSVHGTLKYENRNWKFGFHSFVLFMNAFNFRTPDLCVYFHGVMKDRSKFKMQQFEHRTINTERRISISVSLC